MVGMLDTKAINCYKAIYVRDKTKILQALTLEIIGNYI